MIRTLGSGLPLELHSYGLYDLGPVGPLREALIAAERLKIDISGHRARPLRSEDLSVSDLVLGFEQIHVATAVVDARAPRDRSFTLPELVHLLEEVELPATRDPLDRARLALRAAHELRGGRLPGEVLPEVADPWSQPNTVYVETATMVAQLCDELVSALFGDRVPVAARRGA